MKLLTLLTLALATTALMACGSYEDIQLRRLAAQAVAQSGSVATEARNALRAHGQAGVNALLALHQATAPAATNPTAIAVLAGIRQALDEVSRQRDCYASGLFWFTDLEEAKAAAKQQQKPILSLRLLGNLDEEFSCANSRFFRTTLYANADVSKFLRDHFVLHWQSVRPAPRVTIDFGDGRKIERTITGNSIHYVLDSDGRPLDALPGLYGPKAFIAGLVRAEGLSRHLAAAPAEHESLLRRYHTERLAAIAQQWAQDAAAAGAPIGTDGVPMTAWTTWQQLRTATTDALWTSIAAAHATDAALDSSSRKLIAAKNPNAWQAGRLALSKARVEDPMLRLVRGLERSIAEDTVRNEYLLHAQIHQWLANNEVPGLQPLNTRVYAELFLTPSTDPWLGLLEGNAFTALDNNGIVASAGR